MAGIIFSDELIKEIATEVKNQLVPILIQELQDERLPPLLTRKQFMELVGISEAKCAEVFHIEGFPVTREFGHPRVITKEFFNWLSADVRRKQMLNPRYPYEVV